MPPELHASFGVDQVLEPPRVRDSPLGCVARHRHAAVTNRVPVFLIWNDRSQRRPTSPPMTDVGGDLMASGLG